MNIRNQNLKYEEIDKEMNRRLRAIYSDPSRHAFYSCFDYYNDNEFYSSRGKRIIGKKTMCVHCGGKKVGHAEKDEQIKKGE